MLFVYSVAFCFVIILFLPLGFIPQIIPVGFLTTDITEGRRAKRDKYREQKDKGAKMVYFCQQVITGCVATNVSLDKRLKLVLQTQCVKASCGLG